MTGFPYAAVWRKACVADTVLHVVRRVPEVGKWPALGHFPFAENPRHFAEYLLPILAELKD